MNERYHELPGKAELVTEAALRHDTLEKAFREAVSDGVTAWLGQRPAECERALRFALGRFEEGKRLAEMLRAKLATPLSDLRILDVGSGDGGIDFGLATAGRIGRLAAIDKDANPVIRKLNPQVPELAYVLARGEALPFPDHSFDVVICLESFEHFTFPREVGGEIMRVLAPGGVCILKTPCRFKYLLRPDPHCGIWGLLLLPDSWQRVLTNRLLRRRALYDVHHTYWHLGEMLQHFPGYGNVEVIWDKVFPTTNWLRDQLWYGFRFFSWDSLLIQKRDGSEEALTSWQAWPFPFAQLAAAEVPHLLSKTSRPAPAGRSAENHPPH
jgi:2-polyprenyl-3-methyl-5-hydroxy-6-metoxy-1,4-benzoquinol methylase